MEEIIDVVDENDQKIGQESKQTAHQRGLLHRAS
ncbi:isopentenyl-diphosphate delta-isomerase, partial [Candidatus Woesearchaeota archaeon]|nr:isopentenyl-diphosphate delta-isomerase [Candidatus Woesearchaeota archaeon]